MIWENTPYCRMRLVTRIFLTFSNFVFMRDINLVEKVILKRNFWLFLRLEQSQLWLFYCSHYAFFQKKFSFWKNFYPLFLLCISKAFTMHLAYSWISWLFLVNLLSIDPWFPSLRPWIPSAVELEAWCDKKSFQIQHSASSWIPAWTKNLN